MVDPFHGSISWINSTNLTFDSIKVNKSKAFENGGAFYLIGINDTIIKNSIFLDTKTPDGNGGGIYVDGNITVQNTTFGEYAASVDYGGALYFNSGISTVIDSNFTGRDAIWVYRPATVYLTNNNITGPNPNTVNIILSITLYGTMVYYILIKTASIM